MTTLSGESGPAYHRGAFLRSERIISTSLGLPTGAVRAHRVCVEGSTPQRARAAERSLERASSPGEGGRARGKLGALGAYGLIDAMGGSFRENSSRTMVMVPGRTVRRDRPVRCACLVALPRLRVQRVTDRRSESLAAPTLCHPELMRRRMDIHRLRVGLVIALILVLAGVVIDSLFSASWALDDGLLLAAAAVIALTLFLMRSRV